jgi:hypothetical protein
LKLRTLREDDHSVQSEHRLPEEDFARACSLIESREWDQAYAVLSQLRRRRLTPDLAFAVKTASKILDPRNSSEQTAKRLSQLFSGNVIHLYDNKSGWSGDGLRELHTAQQDGRA